jgi:enoyl-[acyl-carrier-protein] reductase (NADH)
MTFAEKMKDIVDKGVAASRDLAKKAGEKAKELGAKGVLKLEIAQLESHAEKLVAKLGAEVYASMVDRNVQSVSRDTAAISSILKEIEGLRTSIEQKEKEFAALG